ncbi:alpha/beta fold hydrolase [Nesterenkonia ebinurensis]|uniref:alpha/beta fold hydrolase n=1 Tax=Nesterenkonia ebinurensis TaxID=2608252 RepID=UPI00123D063A|nr:alpha/beta hydrolase [Nesterenkonia ebinurensis]
MNHYEHMLHDWPSHQRELIAHRYGRTGVLVAGNVESPPLVLLHGRYTPSPSWTPLIHDLASRYRVYAIDTIGEPGLSVNDGVRLRSDGDYTASLVSTLDGLGLGAAHVCGYSFGGWLAAGLTVAHPSRVRSLTLLDPAQVFAPFRLRWILHCIRPYLFPTEQNINRLFRWAGQGAPGHDDIIELATLAMRSFRIKAPEASLVPKVQLRELDMPVQQLIAVQSVVHSPERAQRRAERINLAVKTLLVEDSSHFIIHNQPTQVLQALDDLITATEQCPVNRL